MQQTLRKVSGDALPQRKIYAQLWKIMYTTRFHDIFFPSAQFFFPSDMVTWSADPRDFHQKANIVQYITPGRVSVGGRHQVTGWSRDCIATQTPRPNGSPNVDSPDSINYLNRYFRITSFGPGYFEFDPIFNTKKTEFGFRNMVSTRFEAI